MSDKPREWRQRVDALIINDLSFEQQQRCNREGIEFVHVIEKFAYDAAVEKYAASILRYDNLVDKYNERNDELCELVLKHEDTICEAQCERNVALAERDAYRKAKAENDERFQLEIGAFKAARDEWKKDYQECYADYIKAVEQWHDETTALKAELEECKRTDLTLHKESIEQIEKLQERCEGVMFQLDFEKAAVSRLTAKNASLLDQLQWAHKNEKQYKDATQEALAENQKLKESYKHEVYTQVCAENQRLREALEFYAHPEVYEERITLSGTRQPGVLTEGEEQARKALESE